MYDEENRVVEVKRHSDSATLAQYEYDALGRRVHTMEYVDAATGAALAAPRKTRHVYVGLETVEELDVSSDANGNDANTIQLREFLWGDSGRFPEPLAMVDWTDAGERSECIREVVYYLHDVLGSVVGLTNEDGELVERYTYDPYGKTYVETADGQGGWTGGNVSVFGNLFLWTGQRYDAGTGLYAFWFRTYSPSLGRWLQRDPAEHAGRVSLYEYVMGNPLTLVDPLGLEPNQKQAFDPCDIVKVIQQLEAKGWTRSQILNYLIDYYGFDPTVVDDRYFYTDVYGWIDAEHFFRAAWWAQYIGEEYTIALGFNIEEFQIFQEAIQSALGMNPYRSGGSYEDWLSNQSGAELGEWLADEAPADQPLTVLFRNWLTINGARSPSDPKSGYKGLPPTDPSAPPGGGSGSGSSSSSGSGSSSRGASGPDPARNWDRLPKHSY